jgi:hypothetical protein
VAGPGRLVARCAWKLRAKVMAPGPHSRRVLAQQPRALPPPRALLVVRGPLGPADVPALEERVRALVRVRGVGVVLCDVGALFGPDAGTVEALARLVLAARRLGRDTRLLHAPPELRELLALAGLEAVLRCAPDQAGSDGGRPKIGKKRAVSRKKVIPLSRSPRISSTWSDQGS